MNDVVRTGLLTRRDDRERRIGEARRCRLPQRRGRWRPTRYRIHPTPDRTGRTGRPCSGTRRRRSPGSMTDRDPVEGDLDLDGVMPVSSHAATSSSSIGREASLISISPLQKSSKPSLVPGPSTASHVRADPSRELSATTRLEMGSTVDEPEIVIEPVTTPPVAPDVPVPPVGHRLVVVAAACRRPRARGRATPRRCRSTSACCPSPSSCSDMTGPDAMESGWTGGGTDVNGG